MATIQINGASIHYETYGDFGRGLSPILLIHGSTIDARADWGLIAPLLAQSYPVIAPDCRGHGRSSNPGRTYRFRELADDAAALIRALGYERAHLIGHSNGGNVALVTLLEHPAVVQSAVLMAANAYVTPDLVEMEPVKFDPERVSRQEPAWMEEMIAIHGPTHGVGYWRDLLRLTMQEIISQPNYTVEQLAQVQRPVLAIQGALDAVNTPARHAEFIARCIPAAELWIAPDTGHNVHHERLNEWVERVLGFLFRRGDDANEALHRLKISTYPDERQAIFEVHAGTESAGISLSGQVSFAEQLDAARSAVQTAAPDRAFDASGVSILLKPDTPWALINRPVDDLRRQPRSLAERVSQALLGEACRVLETQAGWARIRLEADGYMGWTHTAGLYRCSEGQAAGYAADASHLIGPAFLPGFDSPEPDQQLLTRLFFGLRLPVEVAGEDWACARLPDGRSIWLPADGLIPLSELPIPNPVGVAAALARFEALTGTPYLWGGRTPYGFDCSGLAQAFHRFLGLQIPRDADQQRRIARPVNEPPHPGDLIFFGDRDPDDPHPLKAAITHVGISLGGDAILHANGSDWGVSLNHLQPGGPDYRPSLVESYICAGRFLPD
jgi:pimeloyl-ACP methyl ester carboxylesterase